MTLHTVIEGPFRALRRSRLTFPQVGRTRRTHPAHKTDDVATLVRGFSFVFIFFPSAAQEMVHNVLMRPLRARGSKRPESSPRRLGRHLAETRGGAIRRSRGASAKLSTARC